MFLSFFIALLAFLQTSPLVVEEDEHEIILSIDQLEFIEDTTNAITFQEILSEHQNRFVTDSTFQPEDYNRNATYWVRLSLDLPEYRGNYMMEFYDQTIDSIQVYLTDDGLNYDKIQLGDAHAFNEKAIKHKNFEILLNSGQSYTGYFKIKNSQYADIRVAIKRIDRFIFYSLNEYFAYGLFYGMILIISVYNLLIFFAIKERKYWYYTLYILSVGFYAMCVDGMAYQYLWPNWPQWNQIAYGVALFSIIFWSIIFSKRFLNTKVRAPKLHKLINVVLWLRVGLFLLALFYDHTLFRLRNIEIIPLSLIFISSIIVLARGYKPARFFIVAYGFLFLGFIIKALMMISIIPFNIITYYSLHFCFILEMLFLTYALSDRVRILKSNRDRALKRIVTQHEQNAALIHKINKDLERKVAQRTEDLRVKNEELEASNMRITRQSREIAEINSMLDLDNWRLQNNIKKIQRERLMHKNLNYKEFSEIFSSKEVCLEILASFKWKNGFTCQKCDNEKYIENSATLARRCTRCGYNESPTAFSIFKGLKFPLPKAFFIVYTFLNEDKYTLDEMADILNMRRNTIWQFRKKIEEEIETNGKSYLSSLLSYGYERSLNFVDFQ